MKNMFRLLSRNNKPMPITINAGTTPGMLPLLRQSSCGCMMSAYGGGARESRGNRRTPEFYRRAHGKLGVSVCSRGAGGPPARPVVLPAFFEERRQGRRRCNLKGRSTVRFPDSCSALSYGLDAKALHSRAGSHQDVSIGKQRPGGV